MNTITCPWCRLQSEAGSVFCEHCSSDLVSPADIPPGATEAAAEPAGSLLEPMPADHHHTGGSGTGYSGMDGYAFVTMRGLRIGVIYSLFDGHNYVGRADDKPVDIDLEDQEPSDRVWCSRQHAVISLGQGGTVTIEDLGSANGIYVNRERLIPGQPRSLHLCDVIQIGAVHLKFVRNHGR